MVTRTWTAADFAGSPSAELDAAEMNAIESAWGHWHAYPPEEAGWYWYRETRGDRKRTTIVQVIATLGEDRHVYFVMRTPEPMARQALWLDVPGFSTEPLPPVADGNEWSGPIHPPVE